MKRLIDLLSFVVSIAFILFITFPVKAQETDFDYSRFYQAKTDISDAIFAISEPMKVKPDKMLFEILLSEKLSELAQKYPIDYTIIAEQPNNTDLPEMITVVLIGYQDEKSFIGYKFDTIFSEKMVFGFVIALQDRTVPDISWEDYYRYKVVK